jgi:hypothetical protein
VSKEHFDARFQTFSEHFDGQLRLVREHFEAELRVLRAEMEKRFAEMGERIADLRTDMEKGLRDQTWRLAGSFILVVLIATVIQHYWR